MKPVWVTAHFYTAFWGLTWELQVSYSVLFLDFLGKWVFLIEENSREQRVSLKRRSLPVQFAELAAETSETSTAVRSQNPDVSEAAQESKQKNRDPTQSGGELTRWPAWLIGDRQCVCVWGGKTGCARREQHQGMINQRKEQKTKRWDKRGKLKLEIKKWMD